ncbi:hypothetical protein OHC33_011213 [Knufia fluminis]|uniref:NB-ARC domain-containing protein n=1 Tax=Knufia fluminis TaxID=191047 RepID=A0AAN8IH68_9EURO|nr:hypothetical protein OHC33_011213 [Knufia fluminis]
MLIVVQVGPILSGRTSFAGAYAHSSLRPVATYVPRPDLEQRLQAQLAASEGSQQRNETRTVVVWGLGGAGKSQLALRYVQQHQQQYQAVFWIEAGRKETIERDYVQIYKQLYPSLSSGNVTMPVEDAITGVKSWLQGQDKRCLELYIDLNHYLPEAPQLDRIVTTRSSRAQDMSTLEAVAVGEMSEDEAAQLFRRCAKLKQTSGETDHEIKAITKELGYLALALTLAGSYVSETPRLSNLRRYLPEYQAHRRRLLSREARPSIHRYKGSVLSTWEMSFAAIERQNPTAARLLALLAFINLDDIFLRLFKISGVSAITQGPDREDGGSRRWVALLSHQAMEIDEYVVEASFAVLQAYSLVSWRKDQESYSMHKLVHAWGHDRLDGPGRNAGGSRQV